MIDATGGALERPVRLRAVVLVEGLSDRIALEAVASRHGRSLSAEGVSVVDMGGATNVGRFLERFGPPGLDVALTGLYDAPAIKNRNMFLPGTEIALERQTVGEMARRVESRSESTFSRAFQGRCGEAPTACRRRRSPGKDGAAGTAPR